MSKPKKFNYCQLTEDDKKKLLIEKDKRNTQLATNRVMVHFKNYLTVKKHPEVMTLTTIDLDKILSDYYCAVQPKKNSEILYERYSVQSMKCMRAALNRFFRKEMGIDIVKDQKFIRSNEMFQAVYVESKKSGKGVKKSYPPISEIDLERIAEYLCHDHMMNPDPKKLQQTLIFYIIYFFCHKGRGNLYTMSKDTFKLIV